MKTSQLSLSKGKSISSFESKNARIFALLHHPAHWAISLLSIGPHGIVGRHKALSDQLMIVFQVSGMVSGGEF